MTVAEALRTLGGTATWAQLRPVVGKRALLTAIRDGAVVRISRGLYSLPANVDRATARALRGVVSQLSAAAIWELGVFEPVPVVHVTVSRHRSRVQQRAGIKIHYGDVTASERKAGVTRALRTVVDCARTCPVPQALAIADTAVRTALITAAELREATAALCGAGSVAARRVAGWVDPRAASPLESGLRGLLLVNGFGQFEPQLVVVHQGRRIATVDLAIGTAGCFSKRTAFCDTASEPPWNGMRAVTTSSCPAGSWSSDSPGNKFSAIPRGCWRWSVGRSRGPTDRTDCGIGRPDRGI